MTKTPEERAAKAARKLRKAQREAAAARRALNLAAGATVSTPGRSPSPLPAPDAYDEHLMAKAVGRDEIALQLLRKRGTDGVFASYARHVLAKSTDAGQRAYAAGVLAQLDLDFDPNAPQPRPAGSAW